MLFCCQGVQELDLALYGNGGITITGFQLVDITSRAHRNFVEDWGQLDSEDGEKHISVGGSRTSFKFSLQWRHDERDGVSNHRRFGCLLNRLFRRKSKKTKFRVTGLCEGNLPVTGEFPSQRLVTREMFPFDDVIMVSLKNDRCCYVWGVLCFINLTIRLHCIRTWMNEGLKLGASRDWSTNSVWVNRSEDKWREIWSRTTSQYQDLKESMVHQSIMTSSNGNMETFSALLALSAGNSSVTGELPAQWPVTRNFDVFLDLRLNKQLSKQSRRRWFETSSRSLWRHCNGVHTVRAFVIVFICEEAPTKFTQIL